MNILLSLLQRSSLHHNFNFVIAGDGNLFDCVKRQFSSYDNVFVLGRISFDAVKIQNKHTDFFYFIENQRFMIITSQIK